LAYRAGQRQRCKVRSQTPSKKEEITRKEIKKEYAFGYKLQVAVDAELEVPLVTEIASANKHDKTFSTEFMAE